LLTANGIDCNDYKYHIGRFGGNDDFFGHLKAAFDTLYEEGLEGSPKMMTVGLHCRIIGKPGRFAALKRFVEYIAQKEDVWVATVSFSPSMDTNPSAVHP